MWVEAGSQLVAHGSYPQNITTLHFNDTVIFFLRKSKKMCIFVARKHYQSNKYWVSILLKNNFLEPNCKQFLTSQVI